LVIRQGRQLVIRAAELEDSMSARIPDLSIKILKSAASARGPHTNPSGKPGRVANKRSGSSVAR